MARIRTIKPEFPQSETTGRLSRDARLLFIQLWTVVDDEGRTRAASRMLASLLYPYDDDARDLMDDWLNELEHQNCIRRYEVEGSTYLEIINWLKHQKIDHPSKSRLPEFREGSRSLAPDLGPRTSTKDLGPSISSLRDDIASEIPRETLKASDWPCDYRDLFWKQYPRRVGKKAAFKKLDAIRKSGEVTWERLIGGVMKIPIGEPKFTPHPTTWLSEGRWDDEIAPSNGAKNGAPTPSERAYQFAARARELELAAGIGRPPDAVGGDDSGGGFAGAIPNGSGRHV